MNTNSRKLKRYEYVTVLINYNTLKLELLILRSRIYMKHKPIIGIILKKHTLNEGFVPLVNLHISENIHG